MQVGDSHSAIGLGLEAGPGRAMQTFLFRPHRPGLIPPIYVKPFVRRQKNDAADAEAIAEAASRPTMRFVAVKDGRQQARSMIFRRATCWSGSEPSWSTHYVAIWRSTVLSPPKG